MEIEEKAFQYSNQKGVFINADLYYVKINNFEDLKTNIDNELVDIVHADEFYELQDTKHELYERIIKKSIDQQYGMVAEFFVHLVLRDKGYKQYCLYSNLEDNSMKKGFDGLYKLENAFWIVESKSAYTRSKHQYKIKEALVDLRDKTENTNKNNPWQNAVYHINNLISTREKDISLIDKIKNLSKDYSRGISHKISEFNVVPSSTLFLNEEISIEDLVPTIKGILDGKEYKQILILCIDNNIFNKFIEYLKG